MESLTIFAQNNILLIKAVIILLSFLSTFLLTTFLVRKIIFKGKNKIDVDGDGKIDEKDEKLIRDGFIIGKCENIIILCFVLAGEITGLALVFAAKNLARQNKINDNAGFFLAGTMVNFTASLIIGFITRFILDQLPVWLNQI